MTDRQQQPIVWEAGEKPTITVWSENGKLWLLVPDSNAGSHWQPLDPDASLPIGGSILRASALRALVKLHGRPT